MTGLFKQTIKTLYRNYRAHLLAVGIYTMILISLNHAGLGGVPPSLAPLPTVSVVELNVSKTTKLSGTVEIIRPAPSKTKANRDEGEIPNTVQIAASLSKPDGRVIRLGSVLTIPGVGFGVVTDLSIVPPLSGYRIVVTTQSNTLAVGDTVLMYTTTAAK